MPAVQIVDDILVEALSSGVSDIHLESTPAYLRVRYRIDGILCDQKTISLDVAQQVLARIKVLSRVDVAEKRMPQDGKLSVKYKERDIDIRVATFPGSCGEKIVMRILDRPFDDISLDVLGFSSELKKKLLLLTSRSTGFFLVTGPTGSGKTTTLYALLTAIASSEKNIATLEDPIEYTISGVTQGQVQTEIGFTFARGIRALLRQDPDIIMVGEIRDTETAQVAIQAALTGHFVFSTLHTNDCAGAIMRLLDMKIPSFLINATVTGVLAQRLVRVLCRHCRYMDAPDSSEQEFLDHVGLQVRTTYKARGCEICQQRGYKGRTGIFELLIVTPALRELMSQNPSYDALYKQALDDGMVTLMADAIEKIEQGITTIYELARVIC